LTKINFFFFFFSLIRKQDLRELKMLQKQENKQITDLQYKNHIALEAKERKFEGDTLVSQL
jgi:STE20-like kinase